MVSRHGRARATAVDHPDPADPKVKNKDLDPTDHLDQGSICPKISRIMMIVSISPQPGNMIQIMQIFVHQASISHEIS